MKAHTPGPWITTYFSKSDEWTVRVDGDEDIPIVRTFGFESLKEDEANAKLIAAAPELLEALFACKVTLKAFLPDAFETISLAEAAINKAKGL